MPRTVSSTLSSCRRRYARAIVLGLIASSRASADRGDQFAGPQSAVGDGEFDIADDLIVDGQTVMRIDVKEHGIAPKCTIVLVL